MEYRKLGNSGLQVSAVGLGTNNFGGRMEAEPAARVVEEAIDLGINFIDTADIYSKHLSEEYIGRAVKGKRQQVLIATKLGGGMGDGPNEKGASRQHIMRAVEESLHSLNTDYIDLYQIHFPDPTTPIEETLRALTDLVCQGKVRYIGCSNYQAWQAAEAIWTSRTQHLESFASVQPHYNLLTRDVEKELIPFCNQYNMGILPYFPLAAGFLTGKYRRGQNPPDGTRMAGGGGRLTSRWLTDANFDMLDRLENFAAERGHPMVELAISWLLAKPQVSSVIAGATTPGQLQANAKAVEWHLTSEDTEEIDRIMEGAK
jgi:aryl-alcohol dehydrogenase-like predicted oxidoreductase